IYINRTAEAHRALQDRQPSRAVVLLNDCRWDLRHWEWGYLRRLCHPDLLTFYPGGGVHAVAFSPDGKTLAVNGAGPTGSVIRLCAAASGREVGPLRGHAVPVRCLAFSADGKRLASAGWGERDRAGPKEVKVWDVAARKELLGRKDLGGS